jgi:voltage-gated sodium channel
MSRPRRGDVTAAAEPGDIGHTAPARRAVTGGPYGTSVNVSVRQAAELEVTWRDHIRKVVDSRRFQNLIIAIIVINATTLGLETSPQLVERHGDILHALDRIALWIFVAELTARLYAHGPRFFRDPWNCFDLLIVGMRRVVSTLLSAIPGMASIAMLLMLMLYVAGVMSTKLFGATTPEHFGDLGTSLFTLFQVMTGEAWPEIAREVMAEHPRAWIFFVSYILLSTFVVLNLFIAVVVSAMDEQGDEESARDRAHLETVLHELRALRAEVQDLRDGQKPPHAIRTVRGIPSCLNSG